MISSALSFSSRRNENSSQQNDATSVPWISASLMFLKEMSSVLARWPITPPAKQSPAPVGSWIVYSGNAPVL